MNSHIAEVMRLQVGYLLTLRIGDLKTDNLVSRLVARSQCCVLIIAFRSRTAVGSGSIVTVKAD